MSSLPAKEMKYQEMSMTNTSRLSQNNIKFKVYYTQPTYCYIWINRFLSLPEG